MEKNWKNTGKHDKITAILTSKREREIFVFKIDDANNSYTLHGRTDNMCFAVKLLFLWLVRSLDACFLVVDPKTTKQAACREGHCGNVEVTMQIGAVTTAGAIQIAITVFCFEKTLGPCEQAIIAH